VVNRELNEMCALSDSRIDSRYMLTAALDHSVLSRNHCGNPWIATTALGDLCGVAGDRLAELRANGESSKTRANFLWNQIAVFR
jgi:hypothetical protein